MKKIVLLGCASLVLLVSSPRPAEACGCFSPPVPDPTSGEEFAVNQEAEQIIFEVPGDGTVTAHVLIRYQGDPASFAWIVPTPTVPVLGLSETHVFTLLENQTGPEVQNTGQRNLCPRAGFFCRYHRACPPPPVCDPDGMGVPDGGASFQDASAGADAGVGGGGPPPGVEVIDRQTIGAYDTITFGAGDIMAAIGWLQTEGFIVNDTMAPFMQPYADAGMVFVASRLVPGADLDEIRPLRMTYDADMPMIPLRLTAVGTQPHLTVTTYIYGETAFEPDGHPVIDVPTERLGADPSGRVNLPQVLARAIDEAGGDAFIVEYAGASPLADLDLAGAQCCSAGFDACGLGGDGVCQCPAADFDAVDCPDADAIVAGADLMNELATRHARLTRLTTRLSAEEMTFDPGFRPTDTLPAPFTGATTQRLTLARCEDDVMDSDAYAAIEANDVCTSVYCGTGTCVRTADGRAGCQCDAGSVARTFVDLDAQTSVTCVPDTPPVDLEAGGLVLPDACAGVTCGAGICVDLNGFPTCRCSDGNAAALADAPAPFCLEVDTSSGGPGAENYNGALGDLDVCAPSPPGCGPEGWLEERSTTGVLCPQSMPDPARLVPPPAPVCPEDVCRDDDGDVVPMSSGCGCRVTGGSSAPGLFVLALIGLAVWFRRRL